MALWWLVRAGVARVGFVGVPCPCGAGRTFGGFGAFEAWQTAALNAYKRLIASWAGGCPSAIAVALWWLVSCGSGACWVCLGYLVPAELGGLLEGLERLRPGKRQP